jgi:hypothetical protein
MFADMTHTERNATVSAALAAHATKSKGNKAFARRSLVAAGIYTNAGALRPEYGGPTTKAKAKA